MRPNIKNLFLFSSAMLILCAAIPLGDFAFTRLFHHGIFIKSFIYRFVLNSVLLALLFLWFCGILYELVPRRRAGKPVLYLFSAGLPFVIILSLVKTQTDRWYADVKGEMALVNERVFEKDDSLGYRFIADSRVEHILPHRSRSVPIVIDRDGFRAPAAASGPRPLMLFLGDSFTFGACCAEEQAFPALCGRALKASYVNTGAGGYGLAQMLMLAKRKIPRLRPDFVVVQRSPWLLERSVSPFAPSAIGMIPVPYISVRSGGYSLSPPLRFRVDPFGLPLQSFVGTKKSLRDYGRFARAIGVPLILSDALDAVRTGAGLASGAIPRPAADKAGAERYVFAAIDSLCRAAGSRLVVLVLAFTAGRLQGPPGGSLSSIPVAAADSLLVQRLAQRTPDAFSRAYHHWARMGADSVCIDAHPNPAAHAIIAESIVAVIQRMK